MDDEGKPTNIIEAILELMEFFRPKLSDLSTFQELENLIRDRKQWRKAHDLFDRIRDKTLKAIEKKDSMLEAQYCFEEICAKTLYNFSHEPAPFDEDSPFWILPNAVSLAEVLGITDSREISSLLRI